MGGWGRGACTPIKGISLVALVVAAGLSSAHAQERLDPITVVATKTEEKVIDTLAAASAIREEQLRQILPKRLSDIFIATPGVEFQNRGDNPATAINIRGMQDFGRVAVVVDGARQNFQRTGHTANGEFFLDSELLAAADVVRGPTANIYGSGAIGGVVSFRTKDVDDILRPGERFGALANTQIGSNQGHGLASLFGAVRVNPNVEFIAGGSYRGQADYKDGNNELVTNSWNKVGSALAKLTVRPADGHEVKLGGTFQDFQYNFGQPNRSASLTGTSVYATEVQNSTASLGWKYGRPEDNIFNWDAKVYWNRTDQEQRKISHNANASNASALLCGTGVAGNNITGCVGDLRGYVLDTVGFDVNNTSRFQTGDFRHTITLGGDSFRDDVKVTDPHGNSNVTTPSGDRTVSGAFAQYKLNYLQFAELIAAGRYDQYELNGLGTHSDGSRFSPKVTLGITPIPGVTPYVTYAEGYRAPALTETIINGAHVTGSNSGSGGGQFFLCPDGNFGFFCFMPNPSLRPEIGKTKEAGLNLKFDNVVLPGATFRGKFNVFRNDIEDYITFVGVGTFRPGTQSFNFYQYQNIPKAVIEGVEFETMFDAGDWFAGVAGSFQRGTDERTGMGLVSVFPRKITTTVGARFLDRKLVVTAWWVNSEAAKNIPANYLPATDYNIVNLYVGYSPTPDVTAGFGIDNVFNQFYRPYPVPGSTPTDNQRDTLWASPAPGTTYKGSVRIRFGAT